MPSKEAQKRTQAERARRYRERKKEREKAIREWACRPSSTPGRVNLTSLKLSDDTNLCPCCLNKIQMVTSVLGRMTFGFFSKEVPGDPLHNVIEVPPNEFIVQEVPTVKTIGFPIVKQVRICGAQACIDKLDRVKVKNPAGVWIKTAIPDIIEEGDKRLIEKDTAVNPAIHERFYGRDEDEDTRVYDPSWMTSRGRRF